MFTASVIVTAIEGEYTISVDFDDSMVRAIEESERSSKAHPCEPCRQYGCFSKGFFSLDSKAMCDDLNATYGDYTWKEIPTGAFK